MRLDFSVIMITNFTASLLILSILIAFYARFRNEYRGIGYLLLSNSVQLVGIILIGLRGVLPSLLSLAVGNGLIALAFFFAFCGSIRFFGHCHRPRNHVITLGLFLGGYGYFLLTAQDSRALIVLSSAFFIYYSYRYIHYYLIQENRHLKRLQAIQLSLVAFYLLTSTLRIVFALFIADPVDRYIDFHPFGLYLDLALITLGSIMPVFWMIILNDRLRGEITMQENRFESFFMSSPSAMVITDLKTNRIKDANEAFTLLSGFARDDVIGRTATELDLWFDPKERESIIAEAIRKGYVRVANQRFRNRFGEDVYAVATFVVIAYEDDRYLLATVNDITDLHHVQQELESMALHDYLTHLPNRTRLYQYIDGLSEEERDFYTVLMLDLDCFKEINDRFGHDVGDRVLAKVARKLQDAIEEGTFLCRYGGDEFLFVIVRRDQDHLIRTIDRLRTALETPFVIDDHEFYISGSFGYASYPEDGSDFHQAVRMADVRVYETKATRDACERIARSLRVK
ncbi:MAG: diguanylate cyclase domain-containing protein [Acholeplasmataceae bacterium]